MRLAVRGTNVGLLYSAGRVGAAELRDLPHRPVRRRE